MRNHSGVTLPGMSDDLPGLESRLIAIFANDGAAADAARRAGLRLFAMAAPGVGVFAAGPGAAARLYAAGARLVIT